MDIVLGGDLLLGSLLCWVYFGAARLIWIESVKAGATTEELP